MKNIKKQYVRPELYFENFELSANIATGCGRKVEYSTDVCTYETGGSTLFSTNNTGCVVKDTNQDGDPYCYHTLNPDSKLFNS